MSAHLVLHGVSPQQDERVAPAIWAVPTNRQVRREMWQPNPPCAPQSMRAGHPNPCSRTRDTAPTLVLRWHASWRRHAGQDYRRRNLQGADAASEIGRWNGPSDGTVINDGVRFVRAGQASSRLTVQYHARNSRPRPQSPIGARSVPAAVSLGPSDPEQSS
jgi:hypothetical protein